MNYGVFTAAVKHEWKGVRLFNVLVIWMVWVTRRSLQSLSENTKRAKGFGSVGGLDVEPWVIPGHTWIGSRFLLNGFIRRLFLSLCRENQCRRLVPELPL